MLVAQKFISEHEDKGTAQRGQEEKLKQWDVVKQHFHL